MMNKILLGLGRNRSSGTPCSANIPSLRIVKPATSAGEIKKFDSTVGLFRKYGAQYDMDYLLMMAQGYQESLLDQTVISQAGAIGVMQLMPTTGKSREV